MEIFLLFLILILTLKQGWFAMATKAEVLQAIEDEKAQVLEGFNVLNTQIQELKDQIANGSPVTPADLDEITNAVHNIFVPAA